MWAKLVIITDTNYTENVEALKEFEAKYSFMSEIPKTFYKNLDDKYVVEQFEMDRKGRTKKDYEEYLEDIEGYKAAGQYDEFMQRFCERRAAQLKAAIENDIAAYYNSMEEYTVEDGKIYTTSNYVDGKFEFLGELDGFAELKNKNGDVVEFATLEEIDYDSILEDTSLLINTTTGYLTECDFDDDAEVWDRETLEYVKSQDQKLYVFAFGYHF